MSIFGGGNAPQMVPPTVPAAPPPPPMFGSSPQGSKPQQKSTIPTFLGAEALPTQSAQTGFKTLLGT